jgi:glycosyltransferase involved in cell wall biosynthesis
MEQFRIAIIGTRGYPYVYCGYETFVSELVPRLVGRGHRITVYCHRGLFKSYPKVVHGVQLIYIPSVKLKVLSQFTNSFLSTLDACCRRYDIVFYVNSANGPFGLLTKLVRKKTAINIDGLEWLRPKWKGLGAKYFYWSSKIATKLFDVVVSDSERMAEIYKKEFGAQSVFIAYGENIAISQKPELLKSYNLSNGEYYLIVGRLIPDNNASLIVEGFKQSRTRRKLVIVGDVPYSDAYADSLKQTKDPRIIFTGYVRDADILRELYCNSYAYVHGHEYGGTNPTLLKALASGCCVLALDTVFNREVLNEEEHGIFFQKDPKEIARLIDRVDNDQSVIDVFRLKARRRITEKYAWEKITDQYEELFKIMVEKKTGKDVFPR